MLLEREDLNQKKLINRSNAQSGSTHYPLNPDNKPNLNLQRTKNTDKKTDLLHIIINEDRKANALYILVKLKKRIY